MALVGLAATRVAASRSQIGARRHVRHPFEAVILCQAAQRALAGDHAEAASIVEDALASAPPGNAGWLLPIEPLLRCRRAAGHLGTGARTSPQSRLRMPVLPCVADVTRQDSELFRRPSRTSSTAGATIAADEATQWTPRLPRECGQLLEGSDEEHTHGVDGELRLWVMRRHAAVLTLCLSATAFAQPSLPPPANTADLSGPRFGVTFLADGVIEKLAERDIVVGPNISQFGWQFEKQFYTRDSGMTMVTEWVALVGGLDQSVAIPSLSWMVGVRTRDGAEFGLGPNITPAGTALVLATGMTFRAGAFNVPVNVAVVPSKSGARVSLLSGISLRRR